VLAMPTATGYPQQDALIDDVVVTTDAACPVP
jgi:hypothetical protein